MRGRNMAGFNISSRTACPLALLAGLSFSVGCRSTNDALGLSSSPNPIGVSSLATAKESPSTNTLDPNPATVQIGFDEPVVYEPIPGDASPDSPLSAYLQLDRDSEVVEESLSGSAVVVEAIQTAESVETDELTLGQLEATALASHPAISEARARVASTRGQYLQAGLPFNPGLMYRSDEIGNEGSSGLHVVQLSQEYVTANKLGIAQQVQAYEIQKQQAQLRIAELRVLTLIRAAFARAVISQQRAELTNQIVELAERSVSSVVSLVEAKEVSKIELLQAKVEAERARIAAENAATTLKANRRTLAAAAGLAELPAASLHSDVSEDLEDAPWDALLAEIVTTSPEIARAGSELERARWSLSLACAQVTPNITGVVGVGVDTSTDDTFARIGLNIPLPIRNRNQGNIRSARADIAAASAAIERTQLSLDSRLADAVGRYQTARERHERLQTRVVPNAAETFALSRKAFDAGETGFLQLLTAQRTLFATRLSALDALGQAKEALAEIEGLLVTLQP